MIAAQPAKGLALRSVDAKRVRPGRQAQRCRAVDGQYNHIVPNFDYINAVLDAFPEEAVANPDEARVRFARTCLSAILSAVLTANHLTERRADCANVT
jgi:hypothetical protein